MYGEQNKNKTITLWYVSSIFLSVKKGHSPTNRAL